MLNSQEHAAMKQSLFLCLFHYIVNRFMEVLIMTCYIAKAQAF